MKEKHKNEKSVTLHLIFRKEKLKSNLSSERPQKIKQQRNPN